MRYRATSRPIAGPPPPRWPSLRVAPIAPWFPAAETGCAGCGAQGHNVRHCLTEDAARYWASVGNQRRAELVRRNLADLERARRSTVTAGAVARLARRIDR